MGFGVWTRIVNLLIGSFSRPNTKRSFLLVDWPLITIPGNGITSNFLFEGKFIAVFLEFSGKIIVY